MEERDSDQVYVFCNICKENVPIEVAESDIKKASTGLTTILSVHGTPQHAILVYLDKNLKARGVEYPSVLQIDTEVGLDLPAEAPVPDEEIELNSIVSSFGEKVDSAIQSFAQITAQVIVRNPLYLVHNNKGIGKVVKHQLDQLFTEQKTSLHVISYDEIETVSGMRPTIFDLQYGSFISRGVNIESDYFENLVNEAIAEPNGYALLKNELSKLMFSYRRLWELLSSGGKKYTRKRLAYLVSIDVSLIPLLLKIAENDGVDVEARVRLSRSEQKGR
ncbi:MAG: hypothetical protein ACXADC_05375 [Candidatus Thorarchaeota archaeon]|jgi:hypothetical protein